MRARQAIATLLAVAAAIAAVVGAASWWVGDAVADRDAFAARAQTALDSQPAREVVAAEIAAVVRDRVPAEAVPDAAIAEAVDATIATRAFRRAFRRAAADAHATLRAEGGGDPVLRLDVGALLAGAAPELEPVLPAGEAVQVLTLRRDALPVDPAPATDLAATLAAVLPPLAAFALAAALVVAPDRRRALGSAGMAAALAAGLLLLAVTLARYAVIGEAEATGGISRAQARAAAGAVWDAHTGGLRTVAIVAAAAGAVLALATALSRRGSPPRGATRRSARAPRRGRTGS